MLTAIRVQFNQLVEQTEALGFATALKRRCYGCEEAVPVKKDLARLKPFAGLVEHADLALIEITAENCRYPFWT